MITFTCPNCNTQGIVAKIDGKYTASPCDCVAKEDN